LSEELLDVSEATLSNVKVFLKCPTFEDWLRSILKKLCKWKKFGYLLNFSMLQNNKYFGTTDWHWLSSILHRCTSMISEKRLLIGN